MFVVALALALACCTTSALLVTVHVFKTAESGVTLTWRLRAPYANDSAGAAWAGEVVWVSSTGADALAAAAAAYSVTCTGSMFVAKRNPDRVSGPYVLSVAC